MASSGALPYEFTRSIFEVTQPRHSGGVFGNAIALVLRLITLAKEIFPKAVAGGDHGELVAQAVFASRRRALSATPRTM